MPRFSTTVPEDPRGPAYTILRTPTHKPLVAIVTSEYFVGTNTHYYKGRTIPCDAPDCEACRDGIPSRWHGYLCAYNPSAQVHFLFEFTAAAAEPFVEYRKAHGTLRGAKFQATRLHQRPNGRVIIAVTPANLASIKLPQPPDLVRVLSILWGFSLDSVKIDKPNGPHAIITHDRNQDRTRWQPDAIPDNPPDNRPTPTPHSAPKPTERPTTPHTVSYVRSNNVNSAQEPQQPSEQELPPCPPETS